MARRLTCASTLATMAAMLCCAGCGPAYTVYDQNPEVSPWPVPVVERMGFPIENIGVCGPLSADLAELFVFAGYRARDLGGDDAACMDKAQAEHLRYVAIVAPNPDGVWTTQTGDDYIVVVMSVKTGLTLWRADGEDLMRSGVIRTSMSIELALRDMVKAFSRTYPPAHSKAAGADASPEC